VGGLVPLATAGDGGGSIRIPAGFCGGFGLKATFGRIPRGPRADVEPFTVTIGCISRSVRDTARWLDVCNGFDARDPFSLPRVDGWEAGLASHELSGLRVLIAPTLGCAAVRGEVQALVEEHADHLARDLGLKFVDIPIELPSLGIEWALSNLVSLRATLGERWPGCLENLTAEIQFGMQLATQMFNLDQAAVVEQSRRELNRAMADLFDEVDVVIAATSPDVAFGAEGPLPMSVDGVDLVAQLGLERALANNGALTIPSNVYGNPAVSIPIGQVDDLPVGMQVLAAHHREGLLLDLALAVERERPWPLVAPL
jgi:aspartyl-tRNA(Asn)/glutamyl-tRNA(Gln) amidotransferase subunit A